MHALTFVLSFATASLALQLPGLAVLDKREDIEPGTPLYECHAHCGGVILDAGTAGYCTNSTYETDLSDCLECALSEDIWQYYGSYVESAASACGDSSTPSSSSAVSDSAAATTSAAATFAAVTSAAVTTAATSTSAAAATTESSAAATPASSTVAVAATSATAVAASTYTGAASRVKYEKVVLLAGAGAVLYSLGI
ncbi:hypothetical protein EDD36DRAFT_66243 [Exophiala viscosa]|uniref:Uncharacterized protein n=1 Tax=Exophiala viscosa TaxID=2486360 RepID=A0AAN6DPS5_9EURO|nr:hypothetical protein EDD36DRAFT_66243 [Exophiala viscosa]